MLKIKDGIDLKELTKYGFERLRYLPIYQKLVFFNKNMRLQYSYIEYQVDTKTRHIEIRTTDIGDIHTDFILDDTLYDLIKADLIERVE